MSKSDDLISRQAAIDAVYKCTDIFVGNMPVMVDKADAYEALAQLPSAQSEIIHYRDCKHWREGGAYSYCQKLFECGVLDVYDYMRAEDDFCSLAERRTDG